MAEKNDLVFYRTEAGGEPVREWLKDQPKEHRNLIGRDLMRAQFRWPVGMPLCRPLGQKLFEIRTDLPDGTISRVFICQIETVLVALHSCIKKTQKADPEDLKLARKRLRKLERERLTEKKHGRQ